MLLAVYTTNSIVLCAVSGCCSCSVYTSELCVVVLISYVQELKLHTPELKLHTPQLNLHTPELKLHLPELTLHLTELKLCKLILRPDLIHMF